MPEVEATSLKDRIAAFAEEAAQDRERLEAQRAELGTQRDAEVNEIQERHMRALRAEVEEARQKWRERIAQATEELATLRRLDTALNPAKPKPKPKYPSQSPLRKGRRWRPKDETIREALRAMRADGADSVSTITEASSLSRATIDHAIAVMRNDGLVRLTGERVVSPDRPNAKTRTYAATPAGEEFLAANETGSNGAEA